MKYRKSSLLLLSATILSTAFSGLCMDGCGRKNPLREGDCVLNVNMVNLPKEFSLQEENIQEHTTIHVTLQNTTTGKDYPFELNADNTYSQKLSLLPGTYKITQLEGATKEYDFIEYMADAGEVTLINKDMPMQLSVYIGNPDEFNTHWKDIQPLPEIQLEDIFSCKIQWRRELISLADLPGKLSWTESVKPGSTATFAPESLGISMTVKNNSGAECPASNCDLVKAEFTQNCVVFPRGVTIGMKPDKVFHNQDGYYGEPTKLGGTIFFGKDIAPLKAIYKDTTTGTCVTVVTDSKGEYITGIIYEPGSSFAGNNASADMASSTSGDPNEKASSDVAASASTGTASNTSNEGGDAQ